MKLSTLPLGKQKALFLLNIWSTSLLFKSNLKLNRAVVQIYILAPTTSCQSCNGFDVQTGNFLPLLYVAFICYLCHPDVNIGIN